MTTPHRRAERIQRAGAIVVAVLTLAATAVWQYPNAMHWFSTRGLQDTFSSYISSTADDATNAALYAAAQQHNRDLAAGALGAPGLEPAGYRAMLLAPGSDVMGWLTIDAIGVSLPIKHGTAADTLHQAVGHLAASALPVGGDGTRSVLTAHAGLVDARLFTDLEYLSAGDDFAIAVAGHVLRYEVTDIAVVLPDEVDRIKPSPGEDLVTLITCTPVGLNTHRLLVTGSRLPDAGPHPPTLLAAPQPGLPWWLFITTGSTLAGTVLALVVLRPKTH